jgi:hypothetical protein
MYSANTDLVVVASDETQLFASSACPHRVEGIVADCSIRTFQHI